MDTTETQTTWLYGTDHPSHSALRKTKRKIRVGSDRGSVLIDTQNIRGGNRSMIWLSLEDAWALAKAIEREVNSHDW